MSTYKIRCCNPYKETKHSSNLRLISEDVKNHFPLLNDNSRICDLCRLKFIKEIKNDLSKEDVKEIIANLKQKFNDENITKNEKMLLLQLLPKNWSSREVAAFSNTSRWLASKSKLVDNNESHLLEKRGNKKLSIEILNEVQYFYESDENSRIMPGYKDNKCIKNEDGSKSYIQKRLVLYNLRELYLKFKEQHPELKIGFSKFAECRPQYCVLAGASGTHSVCVCVYHQNVKLLLSGLKNSGVSLEKMNTYKDCIAQIVCKDPTPQCYLNNCHNCPGVDQLKNELVLFLENSDIKDIKFQMWQTTDRSTLQTQIVSTLSFIDIFFPLLHKLKTHSFISKQQSSYFQTARESLDKGEFLISLDFSENYAFIAQDAAQSFHYNNNQCSLATAVFYYKVADLKVHKSIVVFSDNLSHDTIAVYCIQKIIINYLQNSFDCVKKVIYFTDGAAQHFKNKYNFQNLIHHYEDFSVEVEWHFHATAHGKNACDGIGASVKSNARRASLRKISDNYILTPQNLYEWASNYFKNIICFFSSKDDYLATSEKLKERLKSAKTVPGTQSFHCVKLLADSKRFFKIT